MPNPNYKQLPPGQGGSNKPMGSPAPTANAGTPTKGPLGPFHVKAEGI